MKGCGYPPILECSNFYETYGYPGDQFPCYVSSVEPDIVITSLDREQVLCLRTFTQVLTEVIIYFSDLHFFDLLHPHTTLPVPVVFIIHFTGLLFHLQQRSSGSFTTLF